MGKKYKIAVTFISIGLCIFTSLFFLFSIEKINDIYVNQARQDIIKLKESFLKDTVNNLIKEIDVERELEKELYEKIIQKQYGIITSHQELAEDEFEKYIANYFHNDKEIDFWNVLIWDSEKKREIYDPQNLVNGEWDEDVKHLNIDFSSYGQIKRENKIIVYGISKEYIDGLVKKKIAEKIRLSTFDEESYVWVNEVINYSGGDNYAIRRVHPNLEETEGAYLSTNITDIEGNFPYKEELDGVNKDGEILFSYYFKKMNSDKVSKKLTYAKLYKDFDWVIAMGVHLDDIQEYIDSTQDSDRKLTSKLTILLVITFSIIIITNYFLINLFNKLYYRHKEKVMESEINKDTLTKAYSRRRGTTDLIRYFKDYLKNGESPAIMIFDIDYFKQINDKYGHDVGDKALKIVVDTVYQVIRNSDIIIRWGGDEFIVILPGLKQENCSLVGEKILSAISLQKICKEGEMITMTISMGFSYFHKDDVDYMDVIKRADSALYEAKTLGRNCFSVNIK